LITIYEDIDKCWKILTETSIKARSIKGYKCRNYKMTANKFMLEEAKPELLEDWDPRLVITTLTYDEEAGVLVMDQAAEKDQKFCTSGKVTLEVISAEEKGKRGDSDVLMMTFEADSGVKAVRKLVRHAKPAADKPPGGRKVSAPF